MKAFSPTSPTKQEKVPVIFKLNLKKEKIVNLENYKELKNSELTWDYDFRELSIEDISWFPKKINW